MNTPTETLDPIRAKYEALKPSFPQIGPFESGTSFRQGDVFVYDLGESGKAAFVMDRDGDVIEVHGGIYDRWKGEGGAGGSLGLPAKDEDDYKGPDARPKDRFSKFENGIVVWRADSWKTEVRFEDGTKLSNLDVYLAWGDLLSLLGGLKTGAVAIHGVEPSGASVTVKGQASVLGFTPNWSICFEPMRSDDGRCLVLHVRTFQCRAFRLYKNRSPFNWTRSLEEYLVSKVSEKIPGSRAEGKHLLIDFSSLLSTIVKTTNSSVHAGKIKYFRSDEGGIRLVIDND